MRVPRSATAAAPAPVLICLHGFGGAGYVGCGDGALSEPHIQVGPSGMDGSWNIVREPSKRDDVAYVAAALLDHLAAFANVRPAFKLYGDSNGAALVNRILIESDDPRITHGVTHVSQLNTHQYRDDGGRSNANPSPATGGTFYIGGAGNAYTTPKTALAARRVLSIIGLQDGVCPALGGAGVFDLTFVDWEDSVYAYAAALGFQGPKASRVRDDDQVAQVSYLGGRVQGHLCKQCGHGVSGTERDAALAAFFAV